MSAALAFRPDGTEAALIFQCKKDAYNTDSLIEFLQDLHGHFPGEKVTVIWDRLSAHKSKAMTAWLAGQRSWLVAELLPPYAHDLNPGGTGLGQREGRRTGQLVPGHHRRSAGRSRVWLEPGRH
jgi:hypothetical protein